jgi:hypothetical protein
MRVSRKAASLLAAGVMAAGVTAAAAPASAASPYWEIVTSPQGFFAPKLCVEGGGTQGSAVTQQACDIATVTIAQEWLPVSEGGDVYKFVNVASGLCLDARGGAADGTPAELWPCSASISNELWARDNSPGTPPFSGPQPIQSRVSGSTGFCLDVPLGQTLSGLQLQISHCDGSAAQAMLFLQAS